MCQVCGCGDGNTRIEGDGPAHEHSHAHDHAHDHEHEHVHADGTRHRHAHSHPHTHPHEHGPGDHGHPHGAHEHHHEALHGPDHVHDHAHDHVHGHGNGHDGAHSHAHVHEQAGALHYGTGAAGVAVPGLSQTRLVQIERDILAKNDGVADGNRRRLAERGIFALNLVSSPGSGKTTLLVRTIELLAGRTKVSVIEGDQQTSVDADRIRATGAPAIQVNTGKGCHLDAQMIHTALDRLAPAEDSVLMIENVGNLVCPAGFDLGEAHKVVVLSVTEGEDKPLKYPDMFHAASLMLLNKADLLPYLRFDVERCLANARKVNPGIEIIQISATTDAGMPEWLAWIERGAAAARSARLGQVSALQARVAELEAQLRQAQSR